MGTEQGEVARIWHTGEWEAVRASTTPWGTNNLSKCICENSLFAFSQTHVCCSNERNIF